MFLCLIYVRYLRSQMLAIALSTLLCLTSGIHGYWTPHPGTSFQWQLINRVDLSVAADVFDIDLFDAKDSDISYLQR